MPITPSISTILAISTTTTLTMAMARLETLMFGVIMLIWYNKIDIRDIGYP